MENTSFDPCITQVSPATSFFKCYTCNRYCMQWRQEWKLPPIQNYDFLKFQFFYIITYKMQYFSHSTPDTVGNFIKCKPHIVCQLVYLTSNEFALFLMLKNYKYCEQCVHNLCAVRVFF